MATYGTVHLDSWAGRTAVPVVLIATTKHRHKVKVLEDYAPKRWLRGDVVHVPHYAFRPDAQQLAFNLEA